MPVLCDEIMTKDVQSCTMSDSVRRAAELMAERHIGSIPVIADEQSRKLLGVVTDRDIVLRAVAARRDPEKTTVGEIMTTDLITCRPSDRADEAVDRMMMHQIRRIYVVDHNGALVGVIAQADVASRYGDRQKTAQMIERVSQPEADQPVSKD
jgi:CBS domain-containing protein